MKLLIAAALGLSLLSVSGVCLAESKSVSINVSATVPPQMEIEVASASGGDIEFGAMQRNADGSASVESPEVIIKTHTNLRKAYQVTQQLITPLSDGAGNEIASGNFAVINVTAEGGGQTQSGMGVSTQSDTLFKSDMEGKSNTIRAVYGLKIGPKQAAGTYRSKLVYTIVTV